MNNIIEIKNLKKAYPNFMIDNLNLSIPRGVIMGLVGENGAGKTTTIKSILNLIKLDEGTIKIFGKDHINCSKIIKEDIGVVLCDSFLPDTLNPKQVSKIMENIYKDWDANKYGFYIEKFKLPIDQILKEYSKGMKLKLQIAVALSHNPTMLILDEPTSGLDPIARSEILDIFLDFIQDEKKSVLFSTHITSDLEQIADYVTFIHNGNVVFSEEKDNLIENYGIIKCRVEQLGEIDSEDIIKYKKNKYDCEVLINDKQKATVKYKSFTINKVDIESIMLMYVKGVK